MTINSPGDPTVTPMGATPRGQSPVPSDSLDPRTQAVIEAALQARNLPTAEQREAAYQSAAEDLMAPLEQTIYGSEDGAAAANSMRLWHVLTLTAVAVVIAVVAAIQWAFHSLSTSLAAVTVSLAVLQVIVVIVSRSGFQAGSRRRLRINLVCMLLEILIPLALVVGLIVVMGRS